MRREAEPWRSPQRSYELLDDVAARVQPRDPVLGAWLERYRRQHRTRLAADLRIVERHVEAGARVLECGAVPLLATGALEAIASLGLDVRKCDLEAEPLPFADETFDAVLFHELFEHLRIRPIATFREVRRVLKAGGVLLLSTPNLRSFRGLCNLVLRHRDHTVSGGIYDQYEKLETLGHMGHVREYTAREVSDFLTRVGFCVDKVIYRGGHGRGAVGIAERLAPSLRPFFSLIARREGAVR